MIFGRLWMKKHEILFNIINNSITFFSGYCIYFRVPLFPVFTMPTKETKIIPIATYQNVFLNQILKKGSEEKIDDFFKILEKTLKKR